MNIFPFKRHKKPEPEIVYVYREGDDDNSYGEEMVEIFSKEKDAKNLLKDRVEKVFGLPFDECETVVMTGDPMNAFSDTFVNEGTSYWIVEARPVNKFYFGKRHDSK